MEYSPDLSDICSDNSTFWGFIGDEKKEFSEKESSSKSFVSEKSDVNSKISISEVCGSNSLNERLKAKQVSDDSGKCKVEFPVDGSAQIRADLSDSKKMSAEASSSENSRKNVSEVDQDDDAFWDFLQSGNSTPVQLDAGLYYKLLSTEKESLRQLNSSEIGETSAEVSSSETIKKFDEFWGFLKPEYPSIIKKEKDDKQFISTNISQEKKLNMPDLNKLATSSCSEKPLDDEDDEFWDFLKPESSKPASDDSKFDYKYLLAAEIEELRGLSSMTPCSVTGSDEARFEGSKYPNTKTHEASTNVQNKGASLDDMYKEVDKILLETNETLKDMGRNDAECDEYLKNKEHVYESGLENKVLTGKSNVEAHSVKLNDKNEVPEPQFINMPTPFSTLSNKTSLGLFQPKIISENSAKTTPQSLSQHTGKTENRLLVSGTCSVRTEIIPTSFVKKNSGPSEQNLRNNAEKIEVCSGSQYLNNISESEAYNVTGVQKSSQNNQNVPEYAEIRNVSNTHLSAKSSYTSISSDLLDKPEYLLSNEKDYHSNKVNDSVLKNTGSGNVNGNLVSSQNARSLNTNFDLDVTSHASKNAISYISPQKPKNAKRLLPRTSPESSVFKVTDSHIAHNQQDRNDTSSLKDEESNKRQKTNTSVNDTNVVSQEKPVLGNEQKFPLVSVKMAVATPNTVTTSFPTTTPFYFIMPKTSQPGQNQPGELFMILSNNTQNKNSTDIKMTTNLGNCTVPVSFATTDTKTLNVQMLNSNDQFVGKGSQHVPFPTISVINLPQTAGVFGNPNSSNPTILSVPAVQSMNTHSNILKPQPHTTTGTNNANILSSSLPQSLIHANNINVYTLPTVAPNVSIPTMSQMNPPDVSLLPSSFQQQNVNPNVNRHFIGGTTLPYKTSPFTSIPTVLSMPSGLMPIQANPQKLKPIKSIPLGKDKNAIQQISIPVKLADLKNFSMTNYNNLVTSTNFGKAFGAEFVSGASQNLQATGMTQQNKIFDFIPYKPKRNVPIVKKNIITNEKEIMSQNDLFSRKVKNYSNAGNKLSINKTMSAADSNQNKDIIHLTLTNIPHSATTVASSSANRILCNIVTTKSSDIKPGTQTTKSQSTLAAIQELFPPPISMIPVCVTPTVQTTSKPAVSKVMVLQNPNSGSARNPAAKTCNRKSTSKKAVSVKVKKPGRKTVRELLQERYRQESTAAQKNNAFQPKAVTRVLKPIYRLTSDGLLLPTDDSIMSGYSESGSTLFTAEMGKGINTTGKSYKRPNIMILPSAAKAMQRNDVAGSRNEKEPPALQMSESCSNTVFDISAGLLFDKTEAAKDYRPRYYDMCELNIGYFKVQDDVDSYGRFRSKFKVLFTKSMFAYDFPVVKCNQMDLCNYYTWEQIVRIQVPFKTIVGMTMSNRFINIQVSKCPQVTLKNNQERVDTVEHNSIADENSMWLDTVQNSLVHKIALRKRQADNLKTHLCLFDPKFLLLLSVGSNSANLDLNPSPFDDETSDEIRRIYHKNKRNVIRRLPQWDSENPSDTFELMDSDGGHLASSNPVCSCRISCRSLRCSCVKAAKSCSTAGTVCQCRDCDNPLNVLDSFGLNLDFSLSDSCLFQNIYQISKLRNFLQRDVTLNCCNTVARVLDCIPGTILCPNTDCNACLEFSWCRGVICYPDRNPRNHCSFCGQCCFSNGRHCPICNRCYRVTSKSPDCPNCTEGGLETSPFDEDFDPMDSDFIALPFPEEDSASTKPTCSSKPEIILLDNPFGAHCKPGDKGTSTSGYEAGEGKEETNEDVRLELINLADCVKTSSGPCSGDVKVEGEDIGGVKREKDNRDVMKEITQLIKDEIKVE